MAEIIQTATVGMTLTFTIDEVEARALDGLTSYGPDRFLGVFYEHLGTHYLKPHEDGLRTLFAAIRREIPGYLKRMDEARAVFTKGSQP